MKNEQLTQKKNELDSFRPLAIELANNLDNWFRVELTFTSNAIEGNTLTRRETAVVIEKGLTVGGKSLREHLEATNHAKALDFVYSLIQKNPSQLTAQDILSIHEIILKGIDDNNAGQYRNMQVRISGSAVIMPNPQKVSDLMDNFLEWLTEKHDLHPVVFAGEVHYRLVTIHPFVDGNGRSARLLMNLILMMYGYPPAIIRKRDRLAYISALEQAQLGGSKVDYENLISKAINSSLDIYLKAAKGTSSIGDIDSDRLLKIGGLAKAIEESVSTIRYWTKEGLLDVAEITDSGYHIYSIAMIERCKQIKILKQKRYTLDEIKKFFRKENV